MQTICPITIDRINNKVARLNSLILFGLIMSFILFDFGLILAFISIDFLIRGFGNKKYSLVCFLSKFMVNNFSLGGRMVNAGPKIFAAQIGSLFSLLATACYLLNYSFASIMVVSILAFFSFLESTFNYCVACKIYPFFRKGE